MSFVPHPGASRLAAAYDRAATVAITPKSYLRRVCT